MGQPIGKVKKMNTQHQKTIASLTVRPSIEILEMLCRYKDFLTINDKSIRNLKNKITLESDKNEIRKITEEIQVKLSLNVEYLAHIATLEWVLNK